MSSGSSCDPATRKYQCRLCLKVCSNNHSICPWDETYESNLTQLVENVITLKISYNSRFPNHICFICHKNLRRFQSFKKRCLESEAYLQTIYNESEDIKPDGIKEDVQPRIKRVDSLNEEDEDNIPLAKLKAIKGRFQCPQCKVKFSKKSLLVQHCNVMHEFGCINCPANFSNNEQLVNHCREIHGYTHHFPFSCRECDLDFSKTTDWMNHMREKHPQCRKCRAYLAPGTPIWGHGCGSDKPKVKKNYYQLAKEKRMMQEVLGFRPNMKKKKGKEKQITNKIITKQTTICNEQFVCRVLTCMRRFPNKSELICHEGSEHKNEIRPPGSEQEYVLHKDFAFCKKCLMFFETPDLLAIHECGKIAMEVKKNEVNRIEVIQVKTEPRNEDILELDLPPTTSFSEFVPKFSPKSPESSTLPSPDEFGIDQD